jgi:hypothetical protein
MLTLRPMELKVFTMINIGKDEPTPFNGEKPPRPTVHT